ncbi:MAG: deoxyribose-phosphate aldolase [Bdellovibrionales bacterium]|nr:deoxyribose-phosphate aldolase [Bdellovibrionales bacterium]
MATRWDVASDGSFRQALDLHIRARYPLLYLPTAEEQRAEEEIRAVAERLQPSWRVYLWDVVGGYQGIETAKGLPLPALEFIANAPADEPAVFVLRDFHVYLREPQVARSLRNLARLLRSRRQSVVLLSPLLEVPATLADEVTILDFPLPRYDDIDREFGLALEGSGVKLASVATAFPSGMSSLKFKLEETKWAVNQGADEIDMVISRGKFLTGEYGFVFDEIAAVKEACGKAHLKVILETGELSTLDNVRRASDLAIAAGADFIKTSTGKVQPAATLPVTLVMLEAIRDHFYRTGKMVGMKPAGGIATAKIALNYLVMVRETLGQAWLDPDWFRFGASALANDVLRQIVKEKTGVYQSFDYFTKD